MNRIIIWLKIIYYYVVSINCYKNAYLMSSLETIEEITNNNRSIIRFGDGELNLIKGKSIHYQEANKELSEELKNIIDYYIEKHDLNEFLLCMPNEFLNCNGLSLAKKRVWVSSWSYFRYYFKKNFDVNINFGDAFLFANEYSNNYLNIWKNKNNIIFVHNEERYATFFEEKYSKKVDFIKIPANNCYSIINELEKKILSCVERWDSISDGVVLISAGPCAKALIYRMKDTKIQMIDTGHCWDDPLYLRKK